jgi:hypothetical protein
MTTPAIPCGFERHDVATVAESGMPNQTEHPQARASRTMESQLGGAPPRPSVRETVETDTPAFAASSRWLSPA